MVSKIPSVYPVLLLIGLGLALRIILVGFYYPIQLSVYSDMENYVRISGELAAGEWHLWQFFQPIGYPMLLAALRALTPSWMDLLAWVHFLAGGLTMVVVWSLASQSFGSRAGLLSLFISAVHLAWITYSGFAFAETMFTLFLALLALASFRLVRSLSVGDAILWGVVFFVALLLKGTHVFLAPMYILGLLLWARRRAWKPALVIAVIITSGLLAHGAFTQRMVGTFQMTASAGGLNFVEGKCPIKDNRDSTGASWLSPLYYQLGKTEQKQWDRPFTDSGYFMKAGLDCIRDNPLVLLQSLESIPFLFIGNWMWPSGNLPYADWIRIYEMAFAIFALVGLCAGAVLMPPGGWRDASLVLVWIVPVLALFACVYVFKSEVRFRVPFDVWIIPLASAGWLTLWRHARSARQTG